MDSLTHLLVGHAMGTVAASAAGPHATAAYWAVLIGNSLPDIDVPISLIFRRDIKLHRTYTHTLPGVVLLSLAAAALLGRFLPGSSFSVAFVGTLLGSLAHMSMDCLNLFGARPLWPLSGRSVDLGVLHILDPVLMLLLGLPTVGVQLGLLSAPALFVGFFAMWPYILYRLATARKLYHRLRAGGSLRARVIPWYASWRYVYETGTAIEFGRWDRGARVPMETYPKHDSPVIQASLQNPAVEAFLKSAEYPYAKVETGEEGHEVVWGDALRQLRADFRPLRIRVNARAS